MANVSITNCYRVLIRTKLLSDAMTALDEVDWSTIPATDFGENDVVTIERYAYLCVEID